MNSPLRILSIGTERFRLRSRSMLLEWSGNSVCEASDLEIGLKGLASEFFDVVIISNDVAESEQQQLILAAKRANPSMAVVLLHQGTVSEQKDLSHARQVDSRQPRALVDTIDDLRRKNTAH